MRMHHLSGTDEKGRIYAMTYEEARSYIEYTDTMGSVLGLDSIKELLRRLGDPQDAVAGYTYSRNKWQRFDMRISGRDT